MIIINVNIFLLTTRVQNSLFLYKTDKINPCIHTKSKRRKLVCAFIFRLNAAYSEHFVILLLTTPVKTSLFLHNIGRQKLEQQMSGLEGHQGASMAAFTPKSPKIKARKPLAPA